MEYLVLLSILLWAMFVLLPMWPAIKIYKLFPDVKVEIAGPLQGLNIKASGAFGAYVVTALLGFFLVLQTQELIELQTRELIEESKNHRWVVTAEVELYDADEKPITGLQLKILLRDLEISFFPEQSVNDKRVKAIFPDRKNATIQYLLDGFATATELLEEKQFDGAELNLGTVRLVEIYEDFDSTQDYLPESHDDVPSVGGQVASHDEQEVALTDLQ